MKCAGGRQTRRGAAKEIQMANGKEQKANVKQFEFCLLPFAI